jgi:hypothetical protein
MVVPNDAWGHAFAHLAPPSSDYWTQTLFATKLKAEFPRADKRGPIRRVTVWPPAVNPLQTISLPELTEPVRLALLAELGFGSDGEFVTQDGKRVVDRYTQDTVRVANMLILPGSTIVIDNNPFSIASYLEEFGDAF